MSKSPMLDKKNFVRLHYKIRVKKSFVSYFGYDSDVP